MKKINYLFAFVALVFAGCNCTLTIGQIPPQTIYADVNCTGKIPDYSKIVTVKENCAGGITFTQIPVAGTTLTSTAPTAEVKLTAKDAFGNSSNTLIIPVMLLDTIPPILEWPAGPIGMTEQQVIDMYKNWEAAVKVHGIAQWMYDRAWQQGLVLADTFIMDSCQVFHHIDVEENLKYFTHTIKLSDEEYAEYVALKNQ